MMFNTYTKMLMYSTLLILCLGSSLTASEKPSDVLRFTIPDIVSGMYDVDITLYLRDGEVSMGYAQVPGRDNMVHRIDVEPSRPIAFVWAKNGKKIDVPEEARDPYFYKNKEFHKYKNLYNKGEVDIVHTAEAPKLSLNKNKLTGMLELKINEVDAVNGPSREKNSLIYRMRIDAGLQGDTLNGEVVYWMYQFKDENYGKDNGKTTVAISGHYLKNHWQAKSDSGYAKGKDWPMAYGPNLTGAAIDSDQPLVKSLHDARLMWVADLPLGSGRGGGLTRGEFAMFPHTWNTLWAGGYGGPSMADGKVFVYAPSPDLEAIKNDPKLERNPYYRLGAKPGHFANKLGHNRESVVAFDAQTGTVLWRYIGKPGRVSGAGGKSGRASSPCYYLGQVFVRMGGSIICLDATSGEKIWSIGGFGLGKGSPGDGSIAEVGGTLIVTKAMEGGWQTSGLDPKDGSIKWSLDFVGGGGESHSWPGNSIPGLYRENGKEYLVLGRSTPIKKFNYEKKGVKVPPQSFLMVDPVDGRILWESDALSYNDSQIVVVGDIAIGNTIPPTKEKMKDPQKIHRIGGVKISTKGAKRIWTQPKVHPSKNRQMNIAHNGIYFSDSRATSFTATDIKSGTLLAKKPGIYTMSQVSHNWSWQVASNDRIITEGLLMYDTNEGKLELMPGRLGNSVSGGYLSPTKAIIVDGRLIYRMPDKLVCYDLRMHPEAAKTEAITLTAKGASIVGPKKEDVEILIRKRGDKLISLGGKAPYLPSSADMSKAVSWGTQDWSTASWFRTVDPIDMKLTDTALSGKARVRLGYQYEPFTFDLKRDGNTFSGTYTRSVPAFDNPIMAKGAVTGPIKTEEDGKRVFVIELDKAACSVRSLRGDRLPHSRVWVVATVDKANELTRIIAHSARMNTMTHEVAVQDFKVSGNDVQAKITIITHDDKYGDLDIVPTQGEFRSIGKGAAIAMEYSFQTTATGVKDEKSGEAKLESVGTYSGTIGVPFTISGNISGTLRNEAIKNQGIELK